MSQRSHQEKGCTAGSREERRGGGHRNQFEQKTKPRKAQTPSVPSDRAAAAEGPKSRNSPKGQGQDLNPREAEEGEGKTSLLKASVLDAHSPTTCKG